MDSGLSPLAALRAPLLQVYLYENNHTCKLIISFRSETAHRKKEFPVLLCPRGEKNSIGTEIKNLDHK